MGYLTITLKYDLTHTDTASSVREGWIITESMYSECTFMFTSILLRSIQYGLNSSSHQGKGLVSTKKVHGCATPPFPFLLVRASQPLANNDEISVFVLKKTSSCLYADRAASIPALRGHRVLQGKRTQYQKTKLLLRGFFTLKLPPAEYSERV